MIYPLTDVVDVGLRCTGAGLLGAVDAAVRAVEAGLVGVEGERHPVRPHARISDVHKVSLIHRINFSSVLLATTRDTITTTHLKPLQQFLLGGGYNPSLGYRSSVLASVSASLPTVTGTSTGAV